MKYSNVYVALLALAGTSVAQGPIVQEDSNGNVFVPGPPAPAPEPVVENKVVVVTRTRAGALPASTATPSPPPPPASSSPATSALPGPGPSPSPSTSNPGGAQSNAGQICINFSGGDFHFANTGSWGTKSGQGAAAASQCFSPQPHGAMFICESDCNGSGDAAPAKYTKLECTFGGGPNGSPNCDVSLVDGYSLPLECTIPGSAPYKIGGLTDLASLASCPSPGGDNTCANSHSYDAGDKLSPPVAEFFTNANTNDPNKPGPAGNYCVWQFCSGPSDSFWDPKTNPTIECQVGTRSAHKKRGDGQVETRSVSEAEVEMHVRRHVGGAHSHARAHVRDLKAVIA